MPRKSIIPVLLSLLILGCADRESPDFNRDIRPILNESCVGCHGGVKQRSDLSLLFREDALKPAKSGLAAIVAGEPGSSEVIRRITHPDPAERMPEGQPPLSDGDIRLLKRWIKNGAEWAPHWAFVKPDPNILSAGSLPSVSDSEWPRNEIDFFILEKLEDAGLHPSGEAECQTLVRRVSLDLVGLPPAPDDVDDVCSNQSERYEAYVDTLLERPSFGERWASMWLDLARYADSQGYEADHYRSIWKFRDWVINAFNEDMPFDRFTIEQLAGDLLPDPGKSQLIATAFSRNSMTNTEGGTDDEEHRYASIIDRVNTTWEVWQGTSFSCAQCHGHPYDPFKQDDYYKFLAFFNNTADWDQSDDRPVLYEFDDEANAIGQDLLAQLDALDAEILELVRTPEESERRRAWESELAVPEVIGRILTTRQNKLLRIARISEPDRSARQQTVVDIVYSGVSEATEGLREERSKLKQKIESLASAKTPVMVELPETERRRTFVFDRGNFLVQQEEVAPDVPESMTSLPDGAPKNRLGVAQWLVSDQNPLTARVTVNRFWEQLFGLGIVETVEDFGTQGIPPSHPELLDWLAVTFQTTDAWSVKSFLKRIVMSSTYRQSSHVSDEHLLKDPRNLLLARSPRVRLTAEQIRDQALAVSGLLSEKMLGPSVMPFQPDSIWRNPYSGATWVTAEGEDKYRRALYTYWRRTSPFPSMVAFDSPSREICVSRRIRTNTPLQALVTLNDRMYVDAAKALAAHMFEEAEHVAKSEAPIDEFRRIAIHHGFKRALARKPGPEEVDVLVDLFDGTFQQYSSGTSLSVDSVMRTTALIPDGRWSASEKKAMLDALTVVANSIMNLDEFITKG